MNTSINAQKRKFLKAEQIYADVKSLDAVIRNLNWWKEQDVKPLVSRLLKNSYRLAKSELGELNDMEIGFDKTNATKF